MGDRTYLTEDREAVRLVTGGDASAFSGLVDRYFGVVRAIAIARLSDSDAADDLAQEVFLQAYLKLNTLRDITALPAWLITMARYRASHWQREQQRRSRILPLIPLDDVTMEIQDTGRPSPRDNAAATERERQLREAVANLPEESREIVLLHYGEGLTQPQLAQYLGVDTSTVCRRLKRAVEQLRGAFESDMQVATRPAASAELAKRRTVATVAAAALLSPSARAGILSALEGAGVTATAAAAGAHSVAAPAASSSGFVSLLVANKALVAVAVALAVVVAPSVYLAHSSSKLRSSVSKPAQSSVIRTSVAPPVRIEKAAATARATRIRTISAASTEATESAAAQNASFNLQAVEPAIEKDSTGTLLRGTVVRPDGSPAAGAVVNMFSYAYTKRPTAIATADANGAFEQPLPAGRYWFYAKQGTLVARDFDFVVIRPEGGASREPVIRLQQGGTVFGKVFDTETNAPVPDALIISDDGDYVRSGNDGTFMIAGMRNGAHSITAFKEGLYRPVVYFDTTARPDSEVTILTKPGGTLRGTVTDEDAKPIAGASVRDLRSGSIFICATMETKTDSAGRFSISGYNTDNAVWGISAEAKGFANSTQGELKFPAGQKELEVNFTLGRGVSAAEGGEKPRTEAFNVKSTVARPLRSIEGRITAPDDSPVSGALVAYGSSTSYVGYVKALSGADGRYRIERVQMENDVIAVQKKGFAPAFAEAGSGTTATLDFKLQPGHSLSGKVVDEGGEPVSGISISVMAYATSNGRTENYRYLEERARSGANGEFTLNNLPADKVAVDFYSSEYSNARDVALLVDKTDHVITLSALGQISGTAVDAENGKPIAGFNVRIRYPEERKPDDPKGGGYQAAYSSTGLTFNSPDGTFTVSELTAKSILRVEVSAPGYRTAVIDRVLVGTTRNIQSGENVFRLAKAQGLEGTVFVGGETSTPLANARVKLLNGTAPNSVYFNYVLNSMEQDLQPVVTYTDAEGKFRFDAAPYDKSSLAVEMEGSGRVLIMDIGTSRTINVEMKPSATVRGVVAGRGGHKLHIENEERTYTARTLIAADGSYELKGVPEGTYWIAWLNGLKYEKIEQKAVLEAGKKYTFNHDGVERAK